MKPLPLHGIRVLDLGQFIAVPFCTQWLSWLGAEVIAVESRHHMTARGAPPFAPGRQRDPNASGYFNLLYGRKKSCSIDLSTTAGQELVRRLAALSDIMVDNFSTGVLEKLGLGYDQIRGRRPDIVMLSCSAFGRTGPMKNAKGFHSAVNLFSGVADVTGYRGGHPRIAGGCLPDPMGGVAAMFAVLAALHHRRRTGEGQYIDLAMYEVMMSAIPEAVIAVTLCGQEPMRMGNRHPSKVPHGVYRCRGRDSWVAISIDGDGMWRSLCAAAGHAEWSIDPRFIDAPSRRANEDALDQTVATWTGQHSPSEATAIMQAAKVTAGPVLRADQLLDDPQLCTRGTVVENDHPVGGRHRQIGLPWSTDSTGADYGRAPLLGEHNREVLVDLLGMSDTEYAALEAQDVLS